MRVFLGRMNEGEGNCRPSNGSTGVVGAVDGVVVVSVDMAEALRLYEKNLSSRSNPLAMAAVLPEWRGLSVVVQGEYSRVRKGNRFDLTCKTGWECKVV